MGERVRGIVRGLVIELVREWAALKIETDQLRELAQTTEAGLAQLETSNCALRALRGGPGAAHGLRGRHRAGAGRGRGRGSDDSPADPPPADLPALVALGHDRGGTFEQMSKAHALHAAALHDTSLC